MSLRTYSRPSSSLIELLLTVVLFAVICVWKTEGGDTDSKGSQCYKYVCDGKCNTFETTWDGCQNGCVCKDKCMVVRCKAGFECRVRVVLPCTKDHCDTVAECVPVNRNCSDCHCDKVCKSGFQQTPEGCFESGCVCNNVCEGKVCPRGKTCDLMAEKACDKGKQCPSPLVSCVPIVKPSACQNQKCKKKCTSGYVKDKRGCEYPLCRCVDECEDLDCPANMMCKPSECETIIYGCPLECVHKCPELKEDSCDKEFSCGGIGNLKDEFGCETCFCKSQCQFWGGECLNGHVCRVNSSASGSGGCTRQPCQPEVYCAQCPVKQCLPRCSSGYVTDDEGCQTCQCVDPCEHTMCNDGKLCIAKNGKPQCCDACCPVTFAAALSTAPTSHTRCPSSCDGGSCWTGQKCCSNFIGCQECLPAVPCPGSRCTCDGFYKFFVI